MIRVRSRHLSLDLGTVAGKLRPDIKPGEYHQINLVPAGIAPMTVFKHRGEMVLNGDSVALEELCRAKGWEDAE